MSSKRSRVHPTYTKYRVKNWVAYDRALVARGDITLWITPDALEAWRATPIGRRGAQPKFSDLAIETALTFRIVLHLPLRQAEGLLRSILRIMGLDIESPDHTTLSRRSQGLALDLRPVSHQGTLTCVTADGAYDTAALYEAAAEREARVVVPPSMTATASRKPRARASPRNRTIERAQSVGRRARKKEAGYHQQARAENAFFRHKTIVGDRLRARSGPGRKVEARIACDVLNRMTELGRPESVAIGA